jgi:NADH-quinone oxidoreductase subunit M
LRMFIRTMHNRVRDGSESREIALADAIVIVPLVLVILAFALYPQAALDASEPAVKGAVQEAVR